MKNFLLSGDRSGRAQDQGADPGHPAGRHADQGQDPRTLPQRDLSRAELSYRRHRGGADLFQQDARRTGPGEAAYLAALPKAPCELSSGARPEAARSSGATTCCARCARTAIIDRGGLCGGAGGTRCRRCRPATIPSFTRRVAAARLFHRRDPPPAVGKLRRGGVLRRRPGDPRHRRSRRCRTSPRRRCATALEKFDRGQGVWRGTAQGDRP